MARREIDGFEVISTTQETGIDFFEPALLVRRLDSQQVETNLHCPISQNVEARSREQAQLEADQWLEGLEWVRHIGDEWDIR